MKVLVIAYFFPPQTSVGGFRTVRLTQALKQQGISAEILTVQNPSPTIHPYAGTMPAQDQFEGFAVHRTREWQITGIWRPLTGAIRRIAALFGKRWNEGDIAKRLWHIDLEYGWIPSALRQGDKIIRRFQPDVIYVSCPPFSSAVIARRLALKHRLPYVLDFRDSWLISDYFKAYEQNRYEAVQSRFLADARALIVTTDSDKQAYQQWYDTKLQQPRNKVHLIHNAYDPAFVGDSHSPDEGPLSLLYTGAWDNNARSPSRVLRSLARVDFDWKLISVGPTNALVSAAAAQLEIDPCHLDLRDSVAKPELVPMMAQAHALVLVQGPPASGGRNTHIAAKTFDYLATGKPIFAIAAPGDNRDFLSHYSEGVYLAADADDDSTVEGCLRQLHADWQSGQLGHYTRDEFLRDYEGRNLANRVIELLGQVAN